MPEAGAGDACAPPAIAYPDVFRQVTVLLQLVLSDARKERILAALEALEQCAFDSLDDGRAAAIARTRVHDLIDALRRRVERNETQDLTTPLLLLSYWLGVAGGAAGAVALADA